MTAFSLAGAAILGLAPAAWAGDVHLARVELLSTDPGTWIHYDLPAVATHATPTAIRFVEQVQPVLALPVDGLHVGLSMTSQSLSYERPLGRSSLGWAAGVQTLLLLPRGAFAELTADWGPARLGLGASVLSHAKWARLGGYGQWDVLPAVSLGIRTRAARGADPGTP